MLKFGEGKDRENKYHVGEDDDDDDDDNEMSIIKDLFARPDRTRPDQTNLSWAELGS